MRTRPARPARGLLAGPAFLLVGLLVGLTGVLTAAPASAHARFVGSDPADGAVVTGLPAAVVMSYSEEISPQFLDTAVVPPGGEPVPTPATVAGTDVTLDLSEVAAGDVAAGTWQVVARVVSADGHPVEHAVALVVEAAPEPAAPATTGPAEASGPVAPTSPGEASEPTGAADEGIDPEQTPSTAPVSTDPLADTGLPRWALVLLAVALVGAAGTALLVQLRRRPPGA